jgi:hypothetical protein
MKTMPRPSGFRALLRRVTVEVTATPAASDHVEADAAGMLHLPIREIGEPRLSWGDCLWIILCLPALVIGVGAFLWAGLWLAAIAEAQ